MYGIHTNDGTLLRQFGLCPDCLTVRNVEILGTDLDLYNVVGDGVRRFKEDDPKYVDASETVLTVVDDPTLRCMICTVNGQGEIKYPI